MTREADEVPAERLQALERELDLARSRQAGLEAALHDEREQHALTRARVVAQDEALAELMARIDLMTERLGATVGREEDLLAEQERLSSIAKRERRKKTRARDELAELQSRLAGEAAGDA